MTTLALARSRISPGICGELGEVNGAMLSSLSTSSRALAAGPLAARQPAGRSQVRCSSACRAQANQTREI